MSADDSLEKLLGTAARLRPDLAVEVIAGTVEGRRIGRLVDDSREVEVGDGFVARQGTVSNGGIHVAEAIERGAAMILGSRATWSEIDPGSLGDAVGLACERPLELGITLVKARPGSEGRSLRIAGVTGTNGKTTVTTLLRQVMDRVIGPCGSIGTIEIHDGRRVMPARVTTPGRLEIAELLGDMGGHGCELLAMEVSSHAIHQGRTADLDFEVAVFTNLSGDHLDYHGTMEEYAAVKSRLFHSLRPEAMAVVNLQDPAATVMLSSCPARTIGIVEGHDDAGAVHVDHVVRVETIRNGPDGMRLRWTGIGSASMEADVPLVGGHNAFNATAAVLVAIEMGARPSDAIKAIEAVVAPRGRLEPVHQEGDSIRVYVDYAHTDEAIRTVLASLRPFVPEGAGLVALIGAGGDRDRTKRPRMMRAALDGADRVMVTSDNPRTEDPGSIVAEVLSGARAEERIRVFAEVDRRRGIDRAIREATVGDVVVIAGKGHENHQIIGTRRLPFDDRSVAREALDRRRKEEG